MEKLKLTRELQGMVVHTKDREYKYMVSNKLLLNCPIITHEINNTNSILVPKLVYVRLKTIRSKLSRVDTEE